MKNTFNNANAGVLAFATMNVIYSGDKVPGWVPPVA